MDRPNEQRSGLLGWERQQQQRGRPPLPDGRRCIPQARCDVGEVRTGIGRQPDALSTCVGVNGFLATKTPQKAPKTVIPVLSTTVVQPVTATREESAGETARLTVRSCVIGPKTYPSVPGACPGFHAVTTGAAKCIGRGWIVSLPPLAADRCIRQVLFRSTSTVGSAFPAVVPPAWMTYTSSVPTSSFGSTKSAELLTEYGTSSR
jgi:hypothetical protein